MHSVIVVGVIGIVSYYLGIRKVVKLNYQNNKNIAKN